MKGIIGLFVVGIIACVASVVILGKTSEDQGYSTAVGFGEPYEGKTHLNLAVGMLTPRKDPPKSDARGNPRWQEWVKDHYKLYDNNRQEVEVNQIGGSSIIPDHKAGNPEFFVAATVNVGETYTMEYIPVRKQKTRYVWKFTVPSAKKTERPNFELAK